MKNIAVVIRTYSRISDTVELVKIIKDLWKKHNYTLFIAHNGKKDGFILPQEVLEYAEIIEVENNLGHRTGAKSLVNVGYSHIKNLNNFDYILFIESDFWLLDDNIIHKAIQADKDISTSIWIEKRQSLGVDFFLVKKYFIDAYPNLLDWQASPETDMRDAFRLSKGSLYIFNELRPIHAPSLMRKTMKSLFKNTYYEGGRFRLFLDAPALTHHIEDLEKGMETKKNLANTLLGKKYFPENSAYALTFFERNMQKIAAYFPQASWFKKK